MKEQKTKELKFIATYARVSTGRQEKQETIKNQTNAMREYAEENGYTIVKEYLDEGWSGNTIIRPNLDRLRQDARTSNWDAVLSYDPDRLARRYSYQELIIDELTEEGLEVLFVTTETPKTGEDKILSGVRGLFSEYERTKIAERFRLGKARKIEEGNILLSEPAYGYDYTKRKENIHGYISVNESEARVVKMIFKWVGIDGLTLRGVVKKLKDLDIKPRKSLRGVWATSTLSTMLRNETYIGKARWGSSEAVIPINPINKEKYKKIKKTSRKIKPKEEWKYVNVPSIIDKKLFDKVRIQLDKNFELCKRNTKNEYLLSSIIYCPCGCKRTGEGPKKGKHLYYRCTNRVKNFPLSRTCFEGGINARVADKKVWNKLSKLMSNQKLMLQQVERFLKDKKNMTKHSDDDLIILKKDRENLKKEEDRYNKAYGAGLFSLETLKEYLGPIRNRLLSIKKQIEVIESENNKIYSDNVPENNVIEEFAKKSINMLKMLDFKRRKEIVLNAIDKIVGTQDQLLVYGRIPVKSYVEYKTISRSRRSPKRG